MKQVPLFKRKTQLSDDAPLRRRFIELQELRRRVQLAETARKAEPHRGSTPVPELTRRPDIQLNERV